MLTPVRGGTIAAVLTCLAIGPAATAGVASARTFGFTPQGALILRPLPPDFPCAIERALHDRAVRYAPPHRHYGTAPRYRGALGR
jgi:hypothetical protein